MHRLAGRFRTLFVTKLLSSTGSTCSWATLSEQSLGASPWEERLLPASFRTSQTASRALLRFAEFWGQCRILEPMVRFSVCLQDLARLRFQATGRPHRRPG